MPASSLFRGLCRIMEADVASDGFGAWYRYLLVDRFLTENLGEECNGYGYGISRYSARVGSDALGPARIRHHLHGDDRQPAIRLDALRQSDRPAISFGHVRPSVPLPPL